MVIVVKVLILVFIVIVLILTFRLNADQEIYDKKNFNLEQNNTVCPNFSSNDILGNYIITNIYGLFSKSIIQNKKELYLKKISILTHKFQFDTSIIENPVYKIKCYLGSLPEGNVPDKRFSFFYGFDTERKYIEVLEIYDPNDPRGTMSYPRFYLEISGGKLWNLTNDFLYEASLVNSFEFDNI